MSDKNVNVAVYTTSWCAYCRVVKEYLKSRNVAFREVDVEHDQGAASALVEKTGQAGVPVIEIGNETIIGFNRQAIDGALREYKLD
jgi:glutaredoxin-like YruB-family protein